MRRPLLTTTEVVEQTPLVRGVSSRERLLAERAARRRSGPAAAVLLAAGIACFVLGLLTILSTASGSVAEALALSDRVGEVSGLSTATALTFVLAWAGLFGLWRRADPPLARVAAVSGALIGLGLVATFPPFFNLFG